MHISVGGLSLRRLPFRSTCSASCGACRHVTILVDVEEKRCPVPMHLERLGCSLEVLRLPVGDYVSGAAAIERKTVRDLHECIVSGRLWSQLLALRRSCVRPFLLVEGMQLDGGRVSARGVRGALLSVAESGTRVVRSRDFGDSAVWISLILSRELRRERPGLRRTGRRTMVVSPAGVRRD